MLKATIYRDREDGTVMFDRDVRDRNWDEVELIAVVKDNASSARLAWRATAVGMDSSLGQPAIRLKTCLPAPANGAASTVLHLGSDHDG